MKFYFFRFSEKNSQNQRHFCMIGAILNAVDNAVSQINFPLFIQI